MRRIRILYLQNASGDRWSLNGDLGCYASNLSGFGVTLAPTYADLTRGFFLPVEDESEPQNTLAFTITFTRNAYAVYLSFIDWVSAAGSLSIVYDPTGSQEFLKDINVNFLQKGELNAVGWLEIACSFFSLSPWYKPVPTSFPLINAGVDESKRYDYTYAESLIYGVDSAGSLSGTIAGTGHIPGALVLTYFGAIVNPSIRLVGNSSGKTYGICSLATSLEDSDRLVFSTRYGDSYVRKVSGGVATDLLDALDLGTTPFFHIPVDEHCTIFIEADAAFTGSADLVLYYYYRSV